MKKRIVPVLGLAALICLVNTSSEVSVSGHKKQSINVHGMLLDQQGNTKKINNIAIGGKVEKIKVYERLAGENMDQVTKTLKQNPVEYAATATLDLPKEVAEIRVNDPVTWTYKKDDKGRKTKYVEIIVVLKHDPARTEHPYLINTIQKLSCDEISPAGPIEMPDMSWHAVKRLTIEGYSDRDTGTG